MDQIGGQLNQARVTAGITLTAMAQRTHFSRAHLSNVEAGRRTATQDVVLAYARALGGDMQRRDILTGLAAGLVAPTAAAELLHHGFTAALRGRDAQDHWLERTTALGQDYMTLGAHELQQHLAADLVVIQQHLESPALWGAAARLLTTYGKTTGNPTDAVSWYRLAATAADRSGDPALRTWVRGRSALALGYEGAALDVADELSTQALQISDAPTLGRLNALMARAHIAGHHGDQRQAIRHAEEALRVFDTTGSEEQISDFAVPAWRMATFQSMLYSRLGHPRATHWQDTADATRPATLPRFATHIELHRGLLLAHTGDRTAGTAYARAALHRLPGNKRSQSLRLMLTEVEQV